MDDIWTDAARHHAKRAAKHLRAGNRDYAAGSLRKAARSYARGENVRRVLALPDFIEPIFVRHMAEFQRMLAESCLLRTS